MIRQKIDGIRQEMYAEMRKAIIIERWVDLTLEIANEVYVQLTHIGERRGLPVNADSLYAIGTASIIAGVRMLAHCGRFNPEQIADLVRATEEAERDIVARLPDFK